MLPMLRNDMKRAMNISVITAAVACFIANAFLHISKAGESPTFSHLNADLYWVFYPNMVFTKRAMLSGLLPLWNPYQSTGEPSLAGLQCVLFYPFNWTIFFLDVPYAMLVVQASAVLVGMFGTVVYLRYLKIHAAGILLAVIMFGYSTLYQSFNCALGSTYAWLPLTLWATHRLFERPSFPRSVTLALILSLCFLGGMPQYFFYTCVVLFVYVVVLAISSGIILRLKPLLARAGLAAAAFVLMGGLVAVQLLPTAELSLRSERNIAGELDSRLAGPTHGNRFSLEDMARDYLERKQWPATWGQLLVMPYFGSLLLLFPFAFSSGRHRKTSLALTASLAYTVLFVLAKEEPMLALFGEIPFSDTFRNHTKMIAFGHFMLAALAGIALSSVFERTDNPSPRSDKRDACALFLKIACVSAAWFGMLYFNSASSSNAPRYLLVFAPVALAAVTLLLSSRRLASPIKYTAALATAFCGAIAVIISVGMLDSFSYVVFFLPLAVVLPLLMSRSIRLFPRAMSIAPWTVTLLVLADIVPCRNVTETVPATTVESAHSAIMEKHIQWLRETAGYYRVLFVPKFHFSPFNVGTLYELYNVNSYQPLTLERWTNFFFEMVEHPSFDSPVRSGVIHDTKEFLQKPRYAGLASLKYVSAGDKFFDEHDNDWRLLQENTPLAFQYVYENVHALPRAYLVTDYLVAHTERESLQSIEDNISRLADMVILENAAPSFEPGGGAADPGIARITEYEINKVELHVETAERCLLVLTDSYYPGWNAYIEGNETPARRATVWRATVWRATVWRATVWRANSLFRAVEIPPGIHKVTFKYQPASFRWGAIVSFSTLVLMTAALAVGRFRSACRKPHAPQNIATSAEI